MKLSKAKIAEINQIAADNFDGNLDAAATAEVMNFGVAKMFGGNRPHFTTDEQHKRIDAIKAQLETKPTRAKKKAPTR